MNVRIVCNNSSITQLETFGVSDLSGAIHEYTRDLLGWKGRIPTLTELQYFINTWLHNCKKKLVNE